MYMTKVQLEKNQGYDKPKIQDSSYSRQESQGERNTKVDVICCQFY